MRKRAIQLASLLIVVTVMTTTTSAEDDIDNGRSSTVDTAPPVTANMARSATM
jgi:hypothetical protein